MLEKSRKTGMNPEFILNFWLDEVGPDYWYSFDETLDGLIEQKFKETFRAYRFRRA